MPIQHPQTRSQAPAVVPIPSKPARPIVITPGMMDGLLATPEQAAEIEDCRESSYRRRHCRY